MTFLLITLLEWGPTPMDTCLWPHKVIYFLSLHYHKLISLSLSLFFFLHFTDDHGLLYWDPTLRVWNNPSVKWNTQNDTSCYF